MKENSSSQVKHAMTYGAIIGLSLVVYTIILYMTNLMFNQYLSIIQYVILFIGLIMSTKTYRDKVLGGFITYGKALAFGIIISVFAGIIVSFFSYVLMHYFDPSLIDKNLGYMEEKYQKSGMSEDQISTTLEMVRKTLVSVWSLPLGVLGFAFFGFLISLITSAFVKKNPNPFD